MPPETRLNKGKTLFKWEASPGLEHHCGICATPLNNARAKTTCLGKHVEPCYRFHQQLHFVGKSHECFGCNTSDEMHHKRHKNISRLVKQIDAIDQESITLTPGKFDNERKPRRGSTYSASTSTMTDTGSEMSIDETKLSKREKKNAKKKERRNVEVFPKGQTDSVSEAIHLSIHETKGGREGTYVYVYTMPEQEENAHADDEDEVDLEAFVEPTNTLSVKAPNLMTPLQRGAVKRFTTPTNHSRIRSGSRKLLSKVSSDDPYDGVDSNIMFRLGVKLVNPKNNTKARKNLVTKLLADIKDDVEIINREEEQSTIREKGFWRWAGKTAYQTIHQNRESIDWATGQRKGPIRCESFTDEDPPLDDLSEAQSVADATPQKALKYNAPPKKKDDDDEWTQVKERGFKPVPRVYMKMSLHMKGTEMRNLHSNLCEDIAEEDAEDVDDMVKRYSQRISGQRNVLSSSLIDTSTSTQRHITLRIK